MHQEREADLTVYKVVVSQQDQYSIWPAYKRPATGWAEAGKQGSKDECLSYITQAWTDMRQKSFQA